MLPEAMLFRLSFPRRRIDGTVGGQMTKRTTTWACLMALGIGVLADETLPSGVRMVAHNDGFCDDTDEIVIYRNDHGFKRHTPSWEKNHQSGAPEARPPATGNRP